MSRCKIKNQLSILVAVVMVMCGIKSTAQSTEFGIRAMPTVSNFELHNASGGVIEGEATIGFGLGAFLGFNFTDHFGIQVEAIYNTYSQKYTEADNDYRVDLKYVNIPLLLSYNTNKMEAVNFNIVAGPQIGISVGSDIFNENNAPNDDAVLSVKNGDLGFAYGAGLDFGLNAAKTFRLGLGFRGVLGLFDISDNSQSIATENYYVLDRTNVKTYSAYLGFSILF
jgi:Outer membrane protein beta-barrel domain